MINYLIYCGTCIRLTDDFMLGMESVNIYLPLPTYYTLHLFFILFRQGSHDALERHQGHRIGRERPQKAGHETSPEPSRTVSSPNRPRRVFPPGEHPPAVPQTIAQRIGHDALFDHVGGVRGDPEDLGGKTSRPEIDGRSR